MRINLIQVMVLVAVMVFCPGLVKAESGLDPFVTDECRFAGEFQQQKRIPELTKELRSTGQFVFDCQAGVIWSTHQPIVESQVFTFSGKHYLVNDENSIEPIEGRHQSYIGQLMLTLISGDEERIRTDFDLTHGADAELVLKPRKRSLKRVLDHVVLQKVLVSDNLKPAIMVELVDRNDQLVRVKSVAQISFTNAQELSSQCSEFLKIQGETLCKLLIFNRVDAPLVP